MKEIVIRIIIEKEHEEKTIPINQAPIQYNEIPIKRIYYNKTDPQYHRRPIKKALKSSKLYKIVKQEPLLDFHWEYSMNF